MKKTGKVQVVCLSVAEMQEKIARVPLCGEKSRRAVLVCLGDVDAQVAEDGYFDAIVPFSAMLSDAL